MTSSTAVQRSISLLYTVIFSYFYSNSSISICSMALTIWLQQLSFCVIPDSWRPPTVILCPRSSMYNGLASGRVNVGTWMDSPAQTACWPTAIMATSEPMLARDGQRDGQTTRRTRRIHNAPAGEPAGIWNVRYAIILIFTSHIKTFQSLTLCCLTVFLNSFTTYVDKTVKRRETDKRRRSAGIFSAITLVVERQTKYDTKTFSASWAVSWLKIQSITIVNTLLSLDK